LIHPKTFKGQKKKLNMQNKELIVISGAGQGIGKNIAFNLADKYDLLLISKTNNCKENAQQILKLSKKSERKVESLKINFEKRINKKKILKSINFKKYNKIHLILCAGLVDPNKHSYLNEEHWIKLFKVNFLSNILIINVFLNFYKNSKSKNKIMIFSGGGAANSFKEFPIYSATKTSIVRTVENYSEIFKNNNLTIFAIAPGAVETGMLKKVSKLAKVGTKSKMQNVVNFVNNCLDTNVSSFHGKLIHIKDNIRKIKKNKNQNYLKLRRYE